MSAPAFDHIDAEEADAILVDEVAMEATQQERGAGKGRKGEINIGIIDKHFEHGDVITLEALQDKKLLVKRIAVIRYSPTAS